MLLWQAKEHGVEIKKCSDILVRGAGGKPLQVEGIEENFMRDVDYFLEVDKIDYYFAGELISYLPCNQKRMLLFDKAFCCLPGHSVLV